MKITWTQTAPGAWTARAGEAWALVATEFGNPECRAEVRLGHGRPCITFWPSIEEARRWCEQELARLAGGRAGYELAQNGRDTPGLSQE